ncbi:angiopoietin-2 isoform X2 [Myotis yumanensis]|uniref:angiopoietin-2 isoform X2 n=1 Tax=Myotis yumanensis TaxID=159337 RepID=UPI0038D1B5F0
MWQLVFLTLSWDLVPAAAHSLHRSMDGVGRRQYQVQHGACSYTFLLPETDNCRPPAGSYVSNAVQRDAPLDYDDSLQRLQVLEGIMENNTQWLMKLESYIQDSMRRGVAALQQSAAHNHTAAMMEMGSSLLNQTEAQTRKLTDVEAQVLNQTTRLELQLLEHSLSTNKLEKQILDQTSEISKLQDKNSVLEKKVLDMEGKHIVQLQSMKEEKDQLQVLVSKQNSIIEELEKQLVTATVNNSVLQKQQHDLMETVHSLLTLVSTSGSARPAPAEKEERVTFRDCAEAFKSGLTTSGVYTLTFPNSTEETKGFGNPAGEHWLGNEFVSQVTTQKRYVLRIRLADWEGNEAQALYEHFSLSGEDLNYRIHLKGLTGSAGKISSISQPGSDFSTKDADKDRCICKCAQMLTGGWWFDACGPSNLNGMYYPQRQSTNRFNGIKWYYWKGSGYSLKATAMMIRPADF